MLSSRASMEERERRREGEAGVHALFTGIGRRTRFAVRCDRLLSVTEHSSRASMER